MKLWKRDVWGSWGGSGSKNWVWNTIVSMLIKWGNGTTHVKRVWENIIHTPDPHSYPTWSKNAPQTSLQNPPIFFICISPDHLPKRDGASNVDRYLCWQAARRWPNTSELYHSKWLATKSMPYFPFIHEKLLRNLHTHKTEGATFKKTYKNHTENLSIHNLWALCKFQPPVVPNLYHTVIHLI